MLERSNCTTRLAALLAVAALALAALSVGCKKSDTGGTRATTAGKAGATRRAGQAGAAKQTTRGARGGQAAAPTAAGAPGGTRGGRGGQATAPVAAGGRAGARGGPGSQAAGAPGGATESSEAAAARLLAAAVKRSGVKVEASAQAQAAKAMAPMIAQAGVIGDRTKEEQVIAAMAMGLKQNQDVLTQIMAGGAAAPRLGLDVNTVAGTEVQKAAKIQRFAALYGPVVWVKEKNWDGRLIEWVTFRSRGMNVKLPVSLIMDAPLLSPLRGYFWIYNNTGFRRVASKQSITAPAGMTAQVLADEKTTRATAAAASKAAAAEAGAATGARAAGGGGARAGGGAGRGGGGMGGGGGRGGRGGGGMMRGG